MGSHKTRTRAIAGLSALALAGSGLFISGAMAGGKDAKSEHWGVINRNTIGSPVAELRDGPYVMTTDGISSPPLGKGSLEIITGDSSEHTAFGNEVDFVGDHVADLSQIGFHVIRTHEDVVGGGNSNLPNITFEVHSPTYASMVWVPSGNGVPENEWSGYIDATDPANGYWYFTGSNAATACGPSSNCTLEQAKTAAGADATILTVAIDKGRDDEFQGAVDGLRINDRTYDFEADGVHAKGVK